MKKLYNKFAQPHFKTANNLVVYQNGQVFINCDIEAVVKQAEIIGMPYEIIKGEYTPKKIEASETKKKK